jgi:serine protease
MIHRIGRAVAFALALSGSGLVAAAAAPSGDALDGAGEEREIAVYFSPEILDRTLAGSPAAVQILQYVHPELRPQRSDVTGVLRYLVDAENAGKIDAIRNTVSRLGGTLGKVMPSPRLQALAKVKMQASRMGKPDVVGLIVHYRDPAKRAAAAKNERLAAADIAKMSSVVGAKITAHRAMSGESYAAALEVPTDLLGGEQLAQRLAMDPEVEWVDLNVAHYAQLVPNDQFFTLQWNLTSAVAGIRAPQAWDITTGSSNIVVGVVDTGYVPHPDFAGRVLQGADTISDPAVARDGSGRDADPTDMGTYGLAGECGASAHTSSWHGTHVMGIIGANGNNGIGIAGVDWNARLLPVRALGRCDAGASADIIDGIAWAAGLDVPGLARNTAPARVINMSLRGPGACTIAYTAQLADAMSRRATVIVAAGNDNSSALDFIPASCALVMTVAAVGPTGDKAPYSNFSTGLEIAAPGGDQSRAASDGIPSAWWTGAQGNPGSADYTYYQGTSQATPHVSGVAALMLAVAPTLSVAQIRDVIQTTATPFPAGSRCATRGDCGTGIVNAAAAVTRARALNGVLNNYTDTFYNPGEPGWGITLQHEGDIIFGAWFNYAASGKAMWYFMSSLVRNNDDVFSGDLFAPTGGTPFNRIAGSQAITGLAKVGTFIITFLESDHAVILYSVNGVVGAKHIFRFTYAAQPPTCSFATGSRTGLTNYQDLWWNASEAGWGLNISHQGNQMFIAWFTYGTDGSPMWLSGQLDRTTGNTFTGPLFQTTGIPAESSSGQQVSRTVANVGSMTLTFANGETGTFSYTALGLSGTKAITRQVFSSPLTQCR